MWLLATAILEGWPAYTDAYVPNYRAGSWGPAVAES